MSSLQGVVTAATVAFFGVALVMVSVEGTEVSTALPHLEQEAALFSEIPAVPYVLGEDGAVLLQAKSELQRRTAPSEDAGASALGSGSERSAQPPAEATFSARPDLAGSPAATPAAAAEHGDLLSKFQLAALPLVMVHMLLEYVMVDMLLVLLIAWIYNRHYRLPAPGEGDPESAAGLAEEGAADFHFGLLEVDRACGRDQMICVCAWCCTGIRWADTISQDKNRIHIGFWALLLLYLVCNACSALTAGITGLIFLLPAVYYRQKLRKVYGLSHGSVGSCCCDMLVWCFCGPCAAAQEAREVHYMPAKVSD